MAAFEFRKYTYIVECLRHQRVLQQEGAKAKFVLFVSAVATVWLAGFRETLLTQLIESNVDLVSQMVCSVVLWLQLGLFFQENEVGNIQAACSVITGTVNGFMNSICGDERPLKKLKLVCEQKTMFDVSFFFVEQRSRTQSCKHYAAN